MSSDNKKLEDILEEVSKDLKTGTELIGGETQNDKITEFQAAARDIREQLKRVEEGGRVMRLGIVGQVKVGKTSFLNALLFEGKTVLPQAATPMTAALTRIRYSRNPSIKVVFYDEVDWNNVEAYHSSYTEKLHKYYQDYLDTFRPAQEKNKGFISSVTSAWQPKEKPMRTEKMTLA